MQRRGRPIKINKEVVGKIEEILKSGWTIWEACSYAGISRDTYYEYINKNNEFSDKMERAKMFPFIFAKHKIFEAMNSKDISLAAKYALEFLRRRDPDRKDKSDNMSGFQPFTHMRIADAETGEVREEHPISFWLQH